MTIGAEESTTNSVDRTNARKNWTDICTDLLTRRVGDDSVGRIIIES